MWIVNFKINPFDVVLNKIWSGVCKHSWGNDHLGSLKEKGRETKIIVRKEQDSGRRSKWGISVCEWKKKKKKLIDDDGLSMAGLVDRWGWYQFISPKDEAKELGWRDPRVWDRGVGAGGRGGLS